MLQENPSQSGQDDLFRSELVHWINLSHPLVKLSKLVDWDGLEADFKPFYCLDNGRPGGSIRLMAGLILLKEIKGISDEELCATWAENPYFQFFCGETYFQHTPPVEPPSIGNFRRRIGEQGMERLLAETIRVGLLSGTVKDKDLTCVVVDTTVQEKAIAYPTDTKLCEAARQALVEKAKENGIVLRQTYERSAKKAVFMARRYRHARQHNRAKKMDKQVHNFLGRVARDIGRKISADKALMAIFAEDLAKAQRIFDQTFNPKTKNKIYSWHAPEVECIGKGKAHKKYEFGCKVSFASTNESNFIIGAQALHGNPFDGHTLGRVLEQIQKLTGIYPKEVAVDRGYRGHGLDTNKIKILMPGQKRGLTKLLRKRLKRRNAIEPIIGHCKNDRKIGPRNWLKGKIGDKINAIAMAIGFNLRKILRTLFLYLLKIIEFMRIWCSIPRIQTQILVF